MALSLTPNGFYYTNIDGLPLIGGKVYTYIAGTTTPKVTYFNSTQSAPNQNTNPIILDASGHAQIWLIAGEAYKFIIKDVNDVQIGLPLDNILISLSGGGIPEAPIDGTTYGRNNAAWTAVTSGGTNKYFVANSITGQATATGTDSIAVGINATSSGNYAIAMGPGGAGAIYAKASGASAIAIGDGATASANNSIALGHRVSNTGLSSVAIGESAHSFSSGCVAIGQNSQCHSIGTDNITIGSASFISAGASSMAFGTSANTSSTNNIAIGNLATITTSSDNSIAIGQNLIVSSANTVRIGGGGGTTDTPNSVVIGFNCQQASSAKFGAVILGYRSKETGNGTTALFNSSTNLNIGAVSIGYAAYERQIANVAGGTLDTDAANIAQLKSVALGYISTISTTSILTNSNYIVAVDASAGVVTLTLPDVNTNTKGFIIHAYDATNTITIDTTSSQQIRNISSDTQTSITLTAGQEATLICAGTFWLLKKF